jgi:hypothetical protein
VEFSPLGVELELMHFINSDSTPVDMVICPVKMRKIERKTAISQAIAKESNFSG